VGIGTNNPGVKLDIMGGTDASGLTNSGFLEIGGTLRFDGNEIITNTGTSLVLQNDNNGDLQVDNGSFYVDSSTNRIGLGTKTPGVRLDIVGTTDASGATNTGLLELGGTLRLDGNEIVTNTETSLSLQAGNNGDLKVDTDTLFVDASAGRVGIGDTTPSSKLDVNGAISISGTEVASSAGYWTGKHYGKVAIVAQTGGDMLSAIYERGKLLVSTDPAYPPQSQLVEGAERPANTKCSGEERTANELSGFDIDVASAVAKGLGVEVCFVTPNWDMIVSGNWAERWDLSIGSMTITPQRMDNLFFTQPYYTTPAAFFVHTDNESFTQPSDLSGKKVGACAGCTYDSYLAGTLAIPGEEITFVVDSPVFMGYETDLNALQDLALGDGVRLDAVLTALPTGDGAIKDGLPLKQLGEPVYFEYLAGAVDKSSSFETLNFLNKVTEIIKGMHSDGTLKYLSDKYYSMDLAEAAAMFDMSALPQYK